MLRRRGDTNAAVLNFRCSKVYLKWLNTRSLRPTALICMICLSRVVGGARGWLSEA